MSPIQRFVVFLFILFWGFNFALHAQSKTTEYKKRSPEEKARFFTQKMVDSLTVTSSEEEALYKMNIIVSKKFDSLNAVVNLLDKPNRSAAYRSIYLYRDSCMRQILPIKQFLKFQDIERERYEEKKRAK